MPEELTTLIKGLITTDYSKRWGYEEIQKWLRGEYVPVHYQVVETKYGAFHFGFIDGEKVVLNDPVELAKLIEKYPTFGKKHLYKGTIQKWVEGVDQALYVDIRGIIEDEYPLDEDAGLIKAIYTLDPSRNYKTFGSVECRIAGEMGDALENEESYYKSELTKNENADFYVFLEARDAKKEADTFRKYAKTYNPERALNTIVLELQGKDKFKIDNQIFYMPVDLLAAPNNTKTKLAKLLVNTDSKLSIWLEQFSELKVRKFITKGSVRSRPAVQDGVVYFGSSESNDHNLYAVDIKTGQEKWKFRTGSYVKSSPAIDDGVVYFGSSESNDHNLYAVDIKTGQEKWKFRTGSYVKSSPAIDDGVVYFGSSESNDHNLYAVDIKTGQEKWKFRTGSYVKSSPAIDDGVVYFGSSESNDHNLYAVDIKTGQEKWKFITKGSVTSRPAVQDGVVYFGSGDFLYAIEGDLTFLADGIRKWRKLGRHNTVTFSYAIEQGSPFHFYKDIAYSVDEFDSLFDKYVSYKKYLGDLTDPDSEFVQEADFWLKNYQDTNYLEIVREYLVLKADELVRLEKNLPEIDKKVCANLIQYILRTNPDTDYYWNNIKPIVDEAYKRKVISDETFESQKDFVVKSIKKSISSAAESDRNMYYQILEEYLQESIALKDGKTVEILMNSVAIPYILDTQEIEYYWNNIKPIVDKAYESKVISENTFDEHNDFLLKSIKSLSNINDVFRARDFLQESIYRADKETSERIIGRIMQSGISVDDYWDKVKPRVDRAYTKGILSKEIIEKQNNFLIKNYESAILSGDNKTRKKMIHEIRTLDPSHSLVVGYDEEERARRRKQKKESAVRITKISFLALLLVFSFSLILAAVIGIPVFLMVNGDWSSLGGPEKLIYIGAGILVAIGVWLGWTFQNEELSDILASVSINIYGGGIIAVVSAIWGFLIEENDIITIIIMAVLSIIIVPIVAFVGAIAGGVLGFIGHLLGAFATFVYKQMRTIQVKESVHSVS
ncbi:MAG: PQQ-binding-like beta-propeller repeat protein [Candidatus Brocadiales bacterium]|nr:PQQ-binding-like beta-propeller repeat protein [Candidatus Brocadiales bacterium]